MIEIFFKLKSKYKLYFIYKCFRSKHLYVICLFYQIFYDTFATYSYKQTNNICHHEFTDMYSHSHPYRHYFLLCYGYTMTTGNIRRKISWPFCYFSYFQPLYLHNTLMRDAKYPLNGWRTKKEN